ncbi:hypothetical protein HHI36_023087 [Cryptolaemus montrouzieri]|uniref:Protein rolling stone n=1 Tax=Cryptolaemus montrouzieri TaxID=559131 RepID=A0ABD2PFR1_9CUCU
MLKTWKKRFSWKELLLIEEEPEILFTCQWQHSSSPSTWYSIYRWLIAIYFFTSWLLSILIVKKKTDGYQVKWLIYLTNWGYTACTFQALLAAFMLSVCVLAYKLKTYTYVKDKVLKAYRLYWAFNIMATTMAFAITIIYWVFVYDKKKNELDIMNFLLHAMNTIVMTLDFWMVSHPFRFVHCIYPLAFSLVYGIFSALYYLAGGTSREGKNYIYSILNWSTPLKCLLVCVGVGTIVFVVHLIYFSMYCLRKIIHKKLGRMKSIELTMTVNDGIKTQDGYINEE